LKNKIKRIYNIIFKEESIIGYLAFFLFLYIVYNFIFLPALFYGFGITDITAVLSGSMKHNSEYSFSEWFKFHNYSLKEIKRWPFQDGINPGDVVICKKVSPEEIKVGDVILYNYGKTKILHRVIKIKDGYFETKGDANPYQFDFEKNISYSQIKGKVILRIPWIGYPRLLLYYLIGI